MKGYKRKLDLAEAEYAQYPSQSTLDRVTYLRGIVEMPGSSLTIDQIKTLQWIAGGKRQREIKDLHKRDLTCLQKKRAALVEHARIRGESWVFVSDLGRFLLRDVEKGSL